MATVLIPNLSDETREILAARAERYPRSFEAELRAILDAAARPEAANLDGPALGRWLSVATRPNGTSRLAVEAIEPITERAPLRVNP